MGAYTVYCSDCSKANKYILFIIKLINRKTLFFKF